MPEEAVEADRVRKGDEDEKKEKKKKRFPRMSTCSISRSGPDPRLSPDYRDARLADLLPIYVSRRYISSFRRTRRKALTSSRLYLLLAPLFDLYSSFILFTLRFWRAGGFRFYCPALLCVVVVSFMLRGPEIL